MSDTKGHISQFKHLLTGLFVGGNVASLIFLYICCVSTWIDPALHPRVAVVGLFFPLILFFNAAFVPFWLIFKKKMVIIPVLGMLACGSFILDYCPVSWHKDCLPQDSTITIVSWNTENMGGKADSAYIEITDFLINSKADIFCLVENSVVKKRRDYLDSVVDVAGYYHGDVIHGREVFSRYPILSADTIPMASKTTNGACCYRLLIQGDTVNLIATHLESNRLSDDDKDEYHEMVNTHRRQEVEDEGRKLLGKLAAASALRAPQVGVLTHYLDSLQGQSVILCGDFNDTPISYSYQQINRRLESAFRHSGNGVGVTYNQAYFWVRIDHLFYSKDWASVSSKVDVSTEASDHYPLIVTLKKREK